MKNNNTAIFENSARRTLQFAVTSPWPDASDSRAHEFMTLSWVISTAFKLEHLLTIIIWPYHRLRYRLTEFDFLKLSADKLLLFKWLQVQVQFFLCKGNRKLCLWAALLNFNFKMTSDERIFSQLVSTRKLLLTFLAHGHDHALVTLYVQFLCPDWSKFDSWVHAKNLCSILKLVCWQLKLTEFCVTLWCF